MVDLAEIQAAYYMVAATGVLVAVVFYIMNLRLTQKKMKIDTTIFYSNILYSKEQIREWRHFFMDTDFTSFEDWVKRYREKPEEFENFYTIIGAMNAIGMLLKEKLIDPEMLMEMVSPVWPKHMWARAAPVIKGLREAYGDPSFSASSEFFYMEAERLHPEVRLPVDRRSFGIVTK